MGQGLGWVTGHAANHPATLGMAAYFAGSLGAHLVRWRVRSSKSLGGPLRCRRWVRLPCAPATRSLRHCPGKRTLGGPNPNGDPHARIAACVGRMRRCRLSRKVVLGQQGTKCRKVAGISQSTQPRQKRRLVLFMRPQLLFSLDQQGIRLLRQRLEPALRVVYAKIQAVKREGYAKGWTLPSAG
jgi:hypothetical protein